MSLTIGAITSGVGSALSGFAQGALTAIKIIASVGFATIFAGAIISLLGLVQQAVFTNVIGEFFAIVSLCLPFNAGFVFGSVVLICDGILAFLIARKIYELCSNLIGISG